MSRLPKIKKETISIQEAAKVLNVSTKTLRRWEAAGKFVPVRTSGGHRRYQLTNVKEFKKLKTQVSGIEDILHEVHGAIVGNPLSKDGGMQARLFQAEKDIEVLSKHVDEMEKKQIKDLLNTEKGQLKTSLHTTIMWSALIWM